MRVARFVVPVASLALAAASLTGTLAAQGRVPPPLTGAARGGATPGPPLLTDFVSFTVTAPPAGLGLDPFYRKYADAQGIPIVSSEKVPDAALLMARDIVTFMLADRPDLRQELIRKKWKVAIMAQTEVTYDIPEHRKYRLLPKIDDERLTPAQRANYNSPGGVGTLTGEQYWNSRGRGFGGEPDGENTTSVGEENLLGYPGTPYFGQPLLMHEFSHGIMRGAIYTVDPAYRQAVEAAYAAAKQAGLISAQGYNGNNFNEYWAGGVEYYTHHDPASREILRQTDPTLHELVSRVMPAHRTSGNVFYGRARLPWEKAARSAQAPQGVRAPQASAPSPDERLRTLYSEEWNWRQRELARTDQPGEAAFSDHFPRVDAASQAARHAYWTRVLGTLDSIPFEQLSAEGKVNAQVFRATVTALAVDVRYRMYEAPLNSDTFFWTEFTPRQGFATVEAYRNYLGRLRDVPRYFDEQMTNLRAGVARGYTVPRVSTVGRDRTIEPYVRADTTNPLYAAFTQMPGSITAADRDALRTEARSVIRAVVAPAYGRLLTMMRTEYLPRTRTTLAAKDLPDGDAFYQSQIEKFTTLTLTARQIHETGLAEVARLEAEMEATKRRSGFTGSMAEFFTFLRTDPQFYAKTPRELLAYSAYISKKADAKLSQTIGFLPRFRHGILPVPENLAPIYTGGRGGLESCLMNTYDLPARPLYTIAPLTLHECTPGHSFQAALALEGPERPPFRRGAAFSAYTEGWGLYTEWLGTVMGIYETPYEEFGRLTYEMWRASRLVIDTGIHQFGWTREQAMAYLRTRAPLSEHEITTEVERYIAWPGQALAYKLGEMQIRRHRREAEAALGAKFDQRKFHDAILALGAVPLPVLEQRVAKFIADGGENPPR